MNHKTSRKNARELIDLAAQLWPKTFVVHEAKRRPLQIGIDKALIATGALTPAEASALLIVYCSNAVYLARSTEGAARVDLNGDVAGYVTAAEAAGCAERLLTRRAPQAAKVNGGIQNSSGGGDTRIKATDSGDITSAAEALELERFAPGMGGAATRTGAVMWRRLKKERPEGWTKGTAPETWCCIDCELNTNPGNPDAGRDGA